MVSHYRVCQKTVGRSRVVVTVDRGGYSLLKAVVRNGSVTAQDRAPGVVAVTCGNYP
jgi:hypothetical protein